ncbi:MAG: hypothetical protein HZA61_16445 [Candidatus Eisenbacteria bacterium]|uniref:Uncharacterized protein n=1 Tax=Eiseniibacteriota bacterium TaxID=2212470 RepID=A0A933SEG9_UNCEI|nr:hypothetical protein [Candidatus Eisenbacteria bacterium]
MSDRCPAIEELEGLLALPEADPRRRHVEDCARCRSLADMLGEFASTTAAPAAAGFAAADASLRETIAELTGVRESREPEGAPQPAAPREFVPEPAPARVRARAPWWSFGALRPAFAFAALLVVASAGVALWRANAPEPVMRDAAGAESFVANPARPVAGGLELSWSAEPGSDEYRVVFLDGALREIARTKIVTDTQLTLESAALPDGLRHGDQVAWYVEARAGGDFVAQTAPRTLRVP